MDKLIEHNGNLDSPLYLPSHLESHKELTDYFEEKALETKTSSQPSLLATARY